MVIICNDSELIFFSFHSIRLPLPILLFFIHFTSTALVFVQRTRRFIGTEYAYACVFIFLYFLFSVLYHFDIVYNKKLF